MLVGVDAVPVAVHPNEVEAPAERAPLYGSFLTVIAPVVPLFTPFHRLLMVCPLASVSFTVQLLIADEPAVTVTLPLKPPVQLLLVE